MGMDVSFHPVDLALVHERLLPYVMGKGNIDDLVTRAVELAKVRFRANAWGLGLIEHQQKSKKPIAGFDTDIHIWGRPFFIVGDTPVEVSAGIDRYLEATPETVDPIAKDMLARFDPKLPSLVAPSAEGSLPPDREHAKALRWKMDLFRDAHAAIAVGKKTVRVNDDDMDPAQLFSRDFALALLEFESVFRPGWMSRGKCWPTLIAPTLAAKYFETAAPLMTPITKTATMAGRELQPTIIENYMVGGFVRAAKVAALAKAVETNRAAIEEGLSAQGWDENERAIPLQKLSEALADAATRNLAFCEATEVYSAPMGIMN